MNKILVTGANGFVGTSVCNALADRDISFTRAVRKKKYQTDVQIKDMTATTDWSEALHQCDAVIHLAARVHVMNDKAIDPMDAYREVNVRGTINLARQAADQGVKRLVFVSS